MVELVLPIFILQNAAENPLIITKEYEGDETAYSHSDLDAFASSETKQCHDSQMGIEEKGPKVMFM